MTRMGRVCVAHESIVNAFMFRGALHWGRAHRRTLNFRPVRCGWREREHMKHSKLSLALAALLGITAMAAVDDVMAMN